MRQTRHQKETNKRPKERQNDVKRVAYRRSKGEKLEVKV